MICKCVHSLYNVCQVSAIEDKLEPFKGEKWKQCKSGEVRESEGKRAGKNKNLCNINFKTFYRQHDGELRHCGRGRRLD